MAEQARHQPMTENIYTIGHSNHTWESFAALLAANGIDVLVDTRSNPVSKYAPFASRGLIPDLLGSIGIRYAYLGGSLGGKPTDESRYDGKGKPDYRKIRATELFQSGIEELIDLAESSVVALMCAEEDPSGCHRRLLIGPALERRGVAQLHIRANGSVQSSGSLGKQKAYMAQLQGTLTLEDT